MSNTYINENEEIQQEVIANTSELIEETFSKPSLFDEQIDIFSNLFNLIKFITNKINNS